MEDSSPEILYPVSKLSKGAQKFASTTSKKKKRTGKLRARHQENL